MRVPDVAESFLKNSHLQKLAGQNQQLLRYPLNHPLRGGPECSLMLTVWHIWMQFMWSYDSYISSIAAALTIHISSSLQLWTSHIQEMCWNQTLTSDNKHITFSLLSKSVFVHPTLRRNCLQSKTYVLFAGWPSEVSLMKKRKGGRWPSSQPALTIQDSSRYPTRAALTAALPAVPVEQGALQAIRLLWSLTQTE